MAAPKNQPHWVLREMKGAGTSSTNISLDLIDNQMLRFGDAYDLSVEWDGTKFEILPLTDDTGSIAIGNGTKDLDVKWYAGTTAKYVLFDMGNVLVTLEDVDLKLGDNDILQFGDASGGDVYAAWDASALNILPATDDTGAINVGNGTKDIDLKWYGGVSTAYALFDVGNARLQLEDVALKINTLSSTVGNGYPLSDSATVVLGAYGDDANAAIGSGTMARVIEGRMLLAYTAGNREEEAVGVLGKLVSKAGTNRHNMCGVMGSYEVNTSLTVGGQAYTTDTWCQAAIIGRIGAGTAITTIGSNAVLAGVAAMSNTTSFATNSGVFTGFYAGRWGGTSLAQWEYGMYAEDVAHGLYLNVSSGTVTGEEHANDLVAAATMASGTGYVGSNVSVTPTGTAASWVSAFYGKVTQGATKAVNGYISGAEFEVINAAANVSDWFPLVLNAQNNGANNGQHESYIALRDYGSNRLNSLLWINDVAIATADATKLISTCGSARTHTHSLRFMHQGTAYYVMCTSTGG